MAMIDASVVRAHHMLFENMGAEAIDGALAQCAIIARGQEAGREYRRFWENGAKLEIVVEGHHVIDCRQASRPTDWTEEKGWKIEWHRNMGRQIFTSDAFRTHLADEQRDGRTIRGDKLRKIFESQPVLTDNWLDFLLTHPEFIPESWKGKATFFWGTGYRASYGGLYVRYLRWYGRAWDWGYYWLGNDWDARNPVALAS